MSLPVHTERLVERILAGYCRRICPPSFRRQRRLGYVIEGDAVVLYESRPVCGIEGMPRRVDVARFRYEPRTADWRLAWSDGEPARWRAHPRTPATRNLLMLLAVVDADPHGLFWGRVNGASLRWCSASGRCASCEARYRAVLGLRPGGDGRPDAVGPIEAPMAGHGRGHIASAGHADT